jgi:hypothetical protein
MIKEQLLQKVNWEITKDYIQLFLVKAAGFSVSGFD